MTLLPASETSSKPSLHSGSLFQLIFSALAAALLLGAAGIFTLIGFYDFLNAGPIQSPPTQSFMVAGSLAFAAALVIPSAWYSWRHLAHPELEPVARSEPRYFGLILTLVVLIVVSGTLLLGNYVSQNDRISWFLLPILNIIATGLPALWVIYFGTRGLLPNKPQYKWGVFASGLVLGPLIILILELFLLLGVAIIAIIWIALNPSLSSQLTNLGSRMQNGFPGNQSVLNAFLPLVLNPGVIFLGFATISVLVPIIEETFKPIGVWFMAGQKITPAQGFGFGVLSGAAFGLFENLGNTSNGGTDWAALAGTRVSTLLLHSFTAGLVGWALASAWTNRRFLRLAASFTLAILIHGLWNGLAVLSAAGSLQGVTSVALPAGLQQIGTLATIGIFTLGLLVLIGFFAFNSVLRQGIPRPVSPEPGGMQPPGTSTEVDLPTSSAQPTAFPPNPGEGLPSPSNLPKSSITDPPHLSPGEESPHTTE